MNWKIKWPFGALIETDDGKKNVFFFRDRTMIE